MLYLNDIKNILKMSVKGLYLTIRDLVILILLLKFGDKNVLNNDALIVAYASIYNTFFECIISGIFYRRKEDIFKDINIFIFIIIIGTAISLTSFFLIGDLKILAILLSVLSNIICLYCTTYYIMYDNIKVTNFYIKYNIIFISTSIIAIIINPFIDIVLSYVIFSSVGTLIFINNFLNILRINNVKLNLFNISSEFKYIIESITKESSTIIKSIVFMLGDIILIKLIPNNNEFKLIYLMSFKVNRYFIPLKRILFDLFKVNIIYNKNIKYNFKLFLIVGDIISVMTNIVILVIGYFISNFKIYYLLIIVIQNLLIYHLSTIRKLYDILLINNNNIAVTIKN